LCVWDVDVQSEQSDNYHLMKKKIATKKAQDSF
jgi:hypothetical protein